MRQQAEQQQAGADVELARPATRSPLPSTNACVTSENAVAPMTKAIASGPALSWIQRQAPLSRSASSGSELPAMKPATQAIACSASTSELRPRTCTTCPRSGRSLRPQERTRVGSGIETVAMTQTASSSATVIASDAGEPAPDDRPGPVVPLVERRPRVGEAADEHEIGGLHRPRIGAPRRRAALSAGGAGRMCERSAAAARAARPRRRSATTSSSARAGGRERRSAARRRESRRGSRGA